MKLKFDGRTANFTHFSGKNLETEGELVDF